MSTDTLRITVGGGEEHRTAARERLRRAEASERGERIEQDAQFVLNFEDFGDVETLMRTSNLDLLEAIATQRPESIRQTAAVVDRDYREVHRNLEQLESLGVIEFDDDGQTKRPILRGGADSVDISFSIGSNSVGDRHEASA